MTKTKLVLTGILTLPLIAAISHPALAANPKKSPDPVAIPAHLEVISAETKKAIFEKLDAQDRKLAEILVQIGSLGRKLLMDQTHRYALEIHGLLQFAFSSSEVEHTKSLLGSAYSEFANYAALFEDANGPYSSKANRKYILKQVSHHKLQELCDDYVIASKANVIPHHEDIIKFLTDPNYETLQLPESDDQDFAMVGGNLYDKGISKAEVEEAFKSVTASGTGVKLQTNVRIVRDEAGKLILSPYAVNNKRLSPKVHQILVEIAALSDRAAKLAKSKHQKAQIAHFAHYIKTGSIDSWNKMNINWVQDGTNSVVDFMSGFVESYQDYFNQIASWETYVSVVDPELTKISKNLAKNAQHFEDVLPYGKFKKTFPEGYSPPAIMVKFLDEQTSMHVLGFNLPNDDGIRRDIGAKNVILADAFGTSKDESTVKIMTEVVSAFLTPSRVAAAVADWGAAIQQLVLFHEIIGHGSGTYDVTKYAEGEDPTSVLGKLGSALEEERADLTALALVGDPELIRIGYFKDAEEQARIQRAAYDNYMVRFFIRVAGSRTLSESHARGNLLFFNHLLKAGAIALEPRVGGSGADDVVVAVKDIGKFQQEAMNLVGQLQDIKANRKQAELTALFENDAPLTDINQPWMQKLFARAESLKYFEPRVIQGWNIENGVFTKIGNETLESSITGSPVNKKSR